jgi:probable DNA repair protein
MMIDPTTEQALQAAAEGALVLTATRRLARRLRRQFDACQAAAGRSAWLSPAIHSADLWLKQAADALGDGWSLLGAPAARHLWEGIVEADAGPAAGLLQVPATARRAGEAHALLCEYRQDPAAWPLTADHIAFLRWRRSYLERCRREGWLDPASLADGVLQGIAGGDLPTPGETWLVGFDELPPRFRRLGEVLAARGGAVRTLAPPVAPRGELLRVACADSREEVRQAARWTRRLLEAGEDQIGIVVPDIEGYRPLLERILREEIDPAAQLNPGAEELRFNLSLGAPLDRQGAVAAALEILGAGLRLSVGQASFLLRTPYLGGSVREAARRANRDSRLRKYGTSSVSLQSLTGGEKSPGEEPRAISFAAACSLLLAAAQDRRRLLPGGWAREFADLLRGVGWPGERPLDSHDYQVVKGWREKVLPQLAAFDLVSGPVARGDAVALVRRLAAETEFQPEGPESPVQVVGLLEAVGLEFRHLWVIGVHDGILPAPPRPNPFLPLPLQVAAGMPHADAAREAAYAGRVAARLFAAAPMVIFSHPLRQGDAGLLPSPLIRAIPAGTVPLAPGRAPVAVLRAGGTVAEVLADAGGPPLADGERVGGGTAILRDQALCPFRAFARHRLGAAALAEPDIGLDAGERGSLLHKAMELFWRETVDQAGLLALDGEGLAARLRRNIAAAVDAIYAERARPAPELLDLEQERLLLLLREWLLEVEARRFPFTVAEPEEKHREQFGGVEFEIRIDRVDRLADGTLAVIDYKTGQVDAADLVEERLLEPQLPIYALGRGDRLGAVALASLRRGRSCFAGVSREAGMLPKVPAVVDWKKTREAGIGGWQELLTRWREQLHALGRAFAAGDAAVDPVSSQKACRLCDLAPFCRIRERDGLSLEGGEE